MFHSENMLKIDIHAEEMELTDAIAAAINEKLGGLDKYLGSVGTPQGLRVNVGKISQHHNKGEVFKAEAELTIPGNVIHAEATATVLYAAIDILKDDLKNRLVKVVKTAIDHHRDGAREAKEQGTETELV
jgi:ribosomal subunit interface protein